MRKFFIAIKNYFKLMWSETHDVYMMFENWVYNEIQDIYESRNNPLLKWVLLFYFTFTWMSIAFIDAFGLESYYRIFVVISIAFLIFPFYILYIYVVFLWFRKDEPRNTQEEINDIFWFIFVFAIFFPLGYIKIIYFLWVLHWGEPVVQFLVEMTNILSSL